MTYVYESPSYDFSYRGYDPIKRALRRKGITAAVECVPRWGDGSREMRIEVPLGTTIDLITRIVRRVQKEFPVVSCDKG